MQVATSKMKNVYCMNTHTSIHIHNALKATCQYLSSFQFCLSVVQSSAAPRWTGSYMCMKKDRTCQTERDELMWWGESFLVDFYRPRVVKYCLRLFQRLSGLCSLTIVLEKKSNVLSQQKFLSMPVFSVAISAISSLNCHFRVCDSKTLCVSVVTWGISIVPQSHRREPYSLQFLLLGSVQLLHSYPSGLWLNLLFSFGTSNSLMMTSVSSQCHHLLTGILSAAIFSIVW